MGEQANAELLYQRSLKIVEQWFGAGHPNTVAQPSGSGCKTGLMARKRWPHFPELGGRAT
jgi:hypothetical protein